jgi:hypothetical protein
MVQTPEVWQGLQRPLMIVKHPLSGVAEPTGFELEPGRLCVGLSRHQLACILVTRDGIGEALDRHQHDCEHRPLGAEDIQWEGWSANRKIWAELEDHDRLFRL